MKKKLKKPPARRATPEPDLMEQTRSAAAYVNSRPNDAGLEIYAFLSIFHPEMTHAQKRQLSRKDGH